MVHRRAFIAGSAAAGALAVVGTASPSQAAQGAAPATSTGAPQVQSVTAITKVYGEGQKLIAVAVEYDGDIADASLSTSTFEVTGRTVTKIYANRTATLAPRGENGRYVIVELSPDDAAALLWVQVDNGGGGIGSGGPTVGDTTAGHAIVPASATLTQTGTLATTRGLSSPASAATLTTDAVVNLIVDEFRQFTFADPATGQTLGYNLFTPRNYDPRRRYPLVLFMHDAGVVNVATIGPLVQGLGAVCWASPEDQERHECFVLAPEYGAIVIDDTYLPSTLFDATVNLVHSITERYSIDRDRVYATGQSMGAMMSLGMNIKHPDLFAASFIVAGQWPADQAAPLAGEKLWILVSQDDTKAFPGENAIVEVIGEAGTPVSTGTWDATSTAAQFAADVRSMQAQHTPVNYATFAPGTVSTATDGGNAHTGTWQVAYQIPEIRDWIMRQSR
jgi:predicted peptidase